MRFKENSIVVNNLWGQSILRVSLNNYYTLINLYLFSVITFSEYTLLIVASKAVFLEFIQILTVQHEI